MKSIATLSAICLVFYVSISLGDEEISNQPVVHANIEGTIYAKSVPSELGGTKGKTIVYQVRRDGDSIRKIYNWYSRQLYLTNSSLVRIGPWNRGSKPNDSDIAIGIYQFDGKDKVYSTKDIEKFSGKYLKSVSHYEVIKQVDGVIDGYLKDGNSTSIFVTSVLKVILVDDKKMYLDMENGDILNNKTVFLKEGFNK